MSEHKYVTHKTYTGPGCAMCGKSEVEHGQPAEVNYRNGVTEGVEPSGELMDEKPFGWDERDYRLWSDIHVLPSFGLVAGDINNPMLARKDVLKLLEKAAKERRAK